MTAPLTAAGESAVADIAARYRVSDGAVRTLLDAVIRGGGAMAQFSHPELGGNGQWMRGGMTMVGDMFNPGLQATVSGICSELSALAGLGRRAGQGAGARHRVGGVRKFRRSGVVAGGVGPAEFVGRAERRLVRLFPGTAAAGCVTSTL